MPLTDVKVRNAKAGEKQVKLADSGGMFLLVTPNGGKWWRLKYRFDGKEKMLAMGTYPDVSLSEARTRRDEARKLLANNTDPSEVKKAKKAAGKEAGADSFEVVAREWHTRFAPTWSDSHAFWIIRRLEQYVFPDIGTRPIGELKAPEVLKVLRRIEASALETAHRVKFVLGQIFRYAVGSGRAERDPTADLKGLLPPRSQEHHAALTDPKDVAGLLRAIDSFTGTFTVRSALLLAPLVFLRPGELRQAEWSEFTLEEAEWNIPIERLKLKKSVKMKRAGEKHLVPLSAKAVAILEDLHALTGRSRYVFPSARSFAKPMSNMAVNAALARMGYGDEMTGHGFRATARTILDEVLGYRTDIVDHQLAHAVKDPNGRAYNRTSFLAYRKFMMQDWSEYLDLLKTSGDPKTAATAILSHSNDRPLPLY